MATIPATTPGRPHLPFDFAISPTCESACAPGSPANDRHLPPDHRSPTRGNEPSDQHFPRYFRLPQAG